MRSYVGSDSSSGTHGAAIATWLQESDRVFIGISNDPCCTNNQAYFGNYYTQILNDIGDSSVTSSNIFNDNDNSNFSLTSDAINTYGFTSPNYNNRYRHEGSQNLILDTSMGVSLTTTFNGYSSALLYLRDDTNSQTLSDVVLFSDVNAANSCLKSDGTDNCSSSFRHNGGDIYNTNIYGAAIDRALAYTADASSTYNLFEDQVTLAGRVYTDAMLTNHYDSGPYAGQRGVFAFAVIPIENFAASGTTNDYFYPNFIPTNLWSYGDLGLHYCAGIISNDQCTSYEENYEWSSYACLLYTSPSPRDGLLSRMPSSA